MTSVDTHESTITATLLMPLLVDEPYMGSGCCVVAADEAIRQELESWPQVLSADVSADTGKAVVTLNAEDADLDSLVETVESLGFPTSIEQIQNTGRRSRK